MTVIQVRYCTSECFKREVVNTWFNIAKICIFLLLLTAALAAFDFLKRKRIVQTTVKKAYEYLGSSARQRQKENRQEGAVHKERGILTRADERLQYSGFKRRFPFLTTELWIVAILGTGAASYLLTAALAGWRAGIGAILGSITLLWLLERVAVYKNFHSTEEQLLVFLNLLENYSITASEITGIFFKVSKYLKEPLHTALAECYFEAQTSGNTSKALYTLADKVEHPKFKELIKNVEVCGRYEADYKIVVNNSRKGVQDYIAYRKKRQAVIRSAKDNIFILVLAGIFAFTMFDRLLTNSIWHTLFFTPLGHCTLLYFLVIIAAFLIFTAIFDK